MNVCYEATRPDPGFDPNRELIFSNDPAVKISAIEFSPNRITFSLDAPRRTEVHLNQNHVRGWSVNDSRLFVSEKQNRPIVDVPAGRYERLSFYYFPVSFIVGFIITVFGIFVALIHSKLRSII